MDMFTYAKEKGFSLVEMLSTTAVLLVVLTIGVPSFNSTLEKSLLDSTTQKVVRALYLSRQLAITQGTDITTCMVINHICQTNWASGELTIFFDEDRNKQIDLNEQVFSRIQITSKKVNLTWNGSGGRPYIRFNNVGYAKEYGNILITVGNYQKKITLNRAGRLYVITL